MDDKVQAVLELWGECMSPDNIANKLGLDVDEVIDIIECEKNYVKQRDAQDVG